MSRWYISPVLNVKISPTDDKVKSVLVDLLLGLLC